jgi:hypothetical protein
VFLEFWNFGILEFWNFLCGDPGVLRLSDKMVGEIGFEPTTPWTQTRCATKLRHSPTFYSLYVPNT